MTTPLGPAAALVRVSRAVLSHHTAARSWGLELVDDDGSQHLTVPRNNGRYVLAGWHVHRSHLPAAHVAERQSLRLTSVPRTVRDLALQLPLDRAVAVADSALRQRLATTQAVRAGLAGRGPGAGTFGGSPGFSIR